ncbi:MAG: DNA repair protein RecO [Candidatus Marinimicrobia bacterium]|nr:DNA repair protein RecO [Candidatus Neomarinimicrobiota bacterium]
MPIQKAEGIILRRIKYSETSLIVTLYTREYGKIGLIAKGARNPKSKFVGSLEPASCVSIIYYHKEGRDLQMLSEVDSMRSNSSIINSIRKIAVAFAIVNLIDSVVTESESNEDIFDLLKESLLALNDREIDIPILWYFEINLLRQIGFEIDVDNPEGIGKGERLKGEALELFEQLEDIDLSEMKAEQFTRGTFKKINRFFEKYFEYHIEGMKQTKALSFVKELVHKK